MYSTSEVRIMKILRELREKRGLTLEQVADCFQRVTGIPR